MGDNANTKSTHFLFLIVNFRQLSDAVKNSALFPWVPYNLIGWSAHKVGKIAVIRWEL